MMPKLQEKVQCVKGERKLNFGNEIIEILVLPILPSSPVKCPKCMLGGVLEMETNCGNGIVENGREKKKRKKEKKKRRIVATKLPKMEGKKKYAMSTTFFTTNYRRLVVIGSNLNLTLRLLFCPNNNNQ